MGILLEFDAGSALDHDASPEFNYNIVKSLLRSGFSRRPNTSGICRLSLGCGDKFPVVVGSGRSFVGTVACFCFLNLIMRDREKDLDCGSV